jgi:hypothetical protein
MYTLTLILAILDGSCRQKCRAHCPAGASINSARGYTNIIRYFPENVNISNPNGGHESGKRESELTLPMLLHVS